MRCAALALPIIMLSSTATAEPGQAFSTSADQSSSNYRIEPGVEKPIHFSRKGIDFRVSEVLQPDGSRKRSRGVLAGMEVAPSAVVGIGIFEMGPKKNSVVGPTRFDGPTKNSRKAAIGLTLKF